MTHENEIPRRALLAGGAAMLTACSASSPGSGTPFDGGSGADAVVPGDTPGDAPGDSSAVVAADVMALNALLAAEYNAIRAYDSAIAALMNPSMTDPLASNGGVIGAVVSLFQSQHRDHAAAVRGAVMMAGGTPVAESSATFTPPRGFIASVANLMKLVANIEKQAAIAYTNTVAVLSTTDRRFLASTIAGDETQHFIVFYTLLKGLVAPGRNIITGVNSVVPASFASNYGSTGMGLQTVADLTYT